MKKNPTCSNSRLDSILVQLISAVKNTRDDEFRAELLFWTLCVRALASRPLSFTLWARGETEHHGREQGMEQSCSCPRGQEVKRERKKENEVVGAKYTLQDPAVNNLPPPKTYIWKVSVLSSTH